MTDVSAGPTARQLRLRGNRVLLLAEFLLVAALFVADAYHHVFFSKTPFLLALAWSSLRLRGIGWREIGFSTGSEWKVPVLAGVLAGIVMECIMLFVTQPMLAKLTGQLPDLSDYTDLVGNYSLLMSVIASGWVVAAFGEELAWRGYLLNRFADLFGRSRAGWTTALVFTSIAFGLAHANIGSISVMQGIVDGALLAGLYFACGRNLLAPVVAHGAYEMLNALVVFSGHYPGLAM